MYDCVAIIPARGGSIRLPRKNVLPFCGIPLFAWSVIQARVASVVDKVYVTTDDDEIVDIAVDYGAEVIRRPQWDDADTCAANKPYEHAIRYLQDRELIDMNHTAIVKMLPTTPIRYPGDIDQLVEYWHKWHVSFIDPMVRRRETVLYRAVHPNVCHLELFDKDSSFYTQGPAINVSNGRWYLDNNAGLESLSDRDLDDRPVHMYNTHDQPFLECDLWQALDVDTLPEFQFAEVVMEHFILQGRGVDCYREYAKSVGKRFDI